MFRNAEVGYGSAMAALAAVFFFPLVWMVLTSFNRHIVDGITAGSVK